MKALSVAVVAQLALGCVAPVEGVGASGEALWGDPVENTTTPYTERVICAPRQLLFDGACRSYAYFGRFVSDDAALVGVFGNHEDDVGVVVVEETPWGTTRTFAVEPAPQGTNLQRDRIYRGGYTVREVRELWGVEGEMPHGDGEPWPWILTIVHGRIGGLPATFGVNDWTLSTDNPNTSAPCEIHMDGSVDCVQAAASGFRQTCDEAALNVQLNADDSCEDAVRAALFRATFLPVPTDFAAAQQSFRFIFGSIVSVPSLRTMLDDAIFEACVGVARGIGQTLHATCDLIAFDEPPAVRVASFDCLEGGCECDEISHDGVLACSSGHWETTTTGTTTDPDTGAEIESIVVTSTEGVLCAELPAPAGGWCVTPG